MIKKRYASMNKFRKRAFAAALATAVASTSFNIGSLAVNAGTSARGRVIVEFEELPEDIADQTLPIGGKKSDINFPENLEVLLYSEEAESEERTDRLEKLDNEEPATVTRREDVSEAPTETDNTAEQSNNGTQDGTVTENTDNTAEPANTGSEDQNAQSTDGTVPAEPATENSDTAGADNNSAPATETDNSNSSGNTETTPETPAEGGSENTDSAESAPAETQDSGSSDGESSEGGSPEGSIGKSLVSAAAEGLKNTFRPVKAYAEELDREESTGDGSLDIAAGSGNSDESGHESGEEGSGSNSGNNEESEPARGNESNTGTNEDSGNSSTHDSDNSNTSNTGTETNNVSDTREEATEASTEQASETADNPSENEVIEEPTEEASESAPSKNETKEEKKESSLKRLTDGEPRTLEDVRWRLDREKSEYGSRFQAVRAGDVFYFVPNIKDFGLKSEVDLPEIRVTIVDEEESVSENSVSEDSISDNSISENSVSENSPEFDQFMIVDGVKVRVTAPEGVFPEDATLKVTKIDDAESNAKIEQAVKEDMGLSDSAEVNGVKKEDDVSEDEEGDGEDESTDTGESLKYVTFDITIIDVSGNEIQPNTENGAANVTFSQADIISEYIDDPGEETDGQLNEGYEGETGEENSGESGKVIVIGDDAEEMAAKKSLRIYHFDDSLENMEKVEREIDESDSAVSVSAEHFSPWTIGVGNEMPPVNIGDYKVTKCEGATLRVTEEDSVVGVWVHMSMSGEADIEITHKDGGGEVTEPIAFYGDAAGDGIVNIKLYDIPFRITDTVRYQNVVNIHRISNINLTINDYRFSGPNTAGSFMNVNASGGKINFDDFKMPSNVLFWNAINLDRSTITFNTISPSELKANTDVFFAQNSVTVNLESEGNEDVNTLHLTAGMNGSEGAILGFKEINGDNSKYIVKSGKYIMDGGSQSCLIDQANGREIYIEGGFIDGRELGDHNDSVRYLDRYVIKGGTHILRPSALGKVSGTDIVNVNLQINGGSIKVYNSSVNCISNTPGTSSSKYLHTVKISENDQALPDLKITGLDGVTTDECIDMYTDEEGCLSLWYNYDTELKSVTSVDNTKYYYTRQIPAAPDDTQDISRYAAPRKTSLFEPLITLVKPDLKTEGIAIGTTKLKPLLTFNCSNGVAYDLSTITDDRIPHVYDRLRDIDWTLCDNSKQAITDTTIGEITSNKTDDPMLTLNNLGTYYLKAELDDRAIIGGELKEWWFRVPEFVPVKDIKSEPEKISVTLGKTYRLTKQSSSEYLLKDNDSTESQTIFTGTPDNATAIKSDTNWTWTLTDPDGTEVSPFALNTDYIFNKQGEYRLKASISNGATESTAYEKTFVITAAKPITQSMITLNPESFSYTGSEIKPKNEVVVKDGSTTLTNGTDYVLSYYNNVNEHDNTGDDAPTIVVEGIGRYCHEATKKFAIVRKSLNDCTVNLKKTEYPYTGSEIKPKEDVEVKDGDTTLVEGTHYKLTYSNNINEHPQTGTEAPTVTVTGLAAYKDSVNKNFAIIRNQIYESMVTLDSDSGTYPYTGTEVKPRVTVKDGSTTLVEGTDYKLKYYNNINEHASTGEGAPYVEIEGLAAYKGVVKKYFAIEKTQITESMVTLAKNIYPYTGSAVEAEVIVKDGETVLAKGTDYKVTYTNNVREHAASGTDAPTATVEGIGKYKGSVVKLFGIKKLPTGSISIAGGTYTDIQTKKEIGAITNKIQTATITAKPSVAGGVTASEFYVATDFYGSEDAIINSIADDKWKGYNDGSKPVLAKNSNNYIYARIIDGEGDKVYLSTKNIIEDEKAPTVSINSASVGSTSGSASVSGTDELSGISKYYLLVKKPTDTKPSASQVKSGGLSSTDGSFTISSLSNKNSYVFYAVAEDKAGNLSQVASKETKGVTAGTIKVMNYKYDVLQGKQEIEAYLKETKEITIEASSGKGIKSVEYQISDKFMTSTATIDKGEWSPYDAASKPNLNKNQVNYIYAKITDGDNKALYISSKGIWVDQTAPTISKVAVTSSDTSAKVTVTAKDEESGLNNYYLLVKKHGEKAPTAADIMKSGQKNTTGTFTVNKLTKGETYDFYTVVTDKVGNVSAVKSVSAVAGGMTAKIKVEDLSYDVLQGRELVEDKYYNEPKEIKITATGASKIEYFITNKFYSSTSELENAANPTSTKTSNTTQNSGTETTSTASKWSVYNDDSRPYLKKNFLNYIYAKITDASGNTIYISSHGIWEDELKPKVTSVKTTPKDKTASGVVKGKDDESGIKYYYLLVKKTTEDAPKKAEDVKGGMRSEDGKFDLSGLSPSTKYNVYAVIEDKAGNLSEIKKGTMSTKKDSASANKAKAAAAGAGAGKGAGAGSGSNVDKRTAGQKDGKGSSSDSSKGSAVRDGVPFIEDASDGILIGREKTSGWDRIESEVGKAQAPAQVFVNMNGSTEVPAAALKECENRDITYYFLMNDDITWAVNGLSFTEAPKNIDFRVRTDTKNIPSKLVNEIADVYPHTNLTLEHSGEFGFTAILSLNVGENNEGMYANLYYYNEDNNSLEFIESTEVDGSGRASFDFVHASDYTVILRGDALTDKSAAALADGSDMGSIDGFGGGSSSPKNVSKNTGHLWLLIVSIISFLLCGFILFMPDKKKKRRGYAGA